MKKRPPVLLLILAVLLTANRAHALQPLEDFLQAARAYHPGNRESRAELDAAQAQEIAAIGELLPSLSLNGSYARNQYETVMSPGTPQEITITPYDQLDGRATIAMPLIDPAGFWRARAAKAQARSSQWRQAATESQIASQIVENYYQVIADLGVFASAERALEVANTSLSISRTLFQSGRVPALDVDRAEAEVERQAQQLATARFQLAVDVRSLRSLTGIEPDLSSSPSLRDDLHEEPPLEAFPQLPDDALPTLAASREARRAQREQSLAQRWNALPSLGTSFTESGTNAEGFGGHEWSWQALLTATWKFDVPTYANIGAQNAQLRAAEAREDSARLSTHDAIHRAWYSVQAAIAKCRSARKQAQVSQHAAELARDRYSIGVTTQLDALQAERDAFLAEVNRIQTEADLANARAQLLLASGHSDAIYNEVTE